MGQEPGGGGAGRALTAAQPPQHMEAQAASGVSGCGRRGRVQHDAPTPHCAVLHALDPSCLPLEPITPPASPCLHPSYVYLGDTAVTGIYAPPTSVVVLRDSDPAAALTEGRPPPLARPINYVRVSAQQQEWGYLGKRCLYSPKRVSPCLKVWLPPTSPTHCGTSHPGVA